MTIDKLREEAKKIGLTGVSKLNKNELERLIAISKQEVIEISKEEFESSITSRSKVLAYDNDDDWEQLRYKRIGGSDIGAILGVNPYKSIIDVYIDKTQGSTFKGNNATYWGTMLEEIVKKEFASRHQELITSIVNCSIVDDFLIANLDGVLQNKETGEYGALEIKTANAFSKDWEEDIVPQTYYAQVQHYLMLTGYKFAYIAVLIGGQNYKEYFIERNEEDIQLIKTKATEFYNENILKEVPPMPDGSDAYMEHLKKRAKEIENNEVIELDNFDEDVERLKELSVKKKEIETEENKIKENIMLTMINQDTLKAIVGKNKFNIQSKVSLDEDRLEKENPILFEQYKKADLVINDIKAKYYKESKFIKPYLARN